MAYWLNLDVDISRFRDLCESNGVAISILNGHIGLSFASMSKELMLDGVIRLAEIWSEEDK